MSKNNQDNYDEMDDDFFQIQLKYYQFRREDNRIQVENNQNNFEEKIIK